MRTLLLLLAIASPTWAVDASDTLLNGGGTLRVAPSAGDTVGTYSVVCAIDAAAATQVRAAVTNRSRRRICLQNSSNVLVALGTSTVVASDLWRLGESTNTATSPIYCTNSSAALYCATTAATVSSSTVRVIEETQSAP